MHRSLIIAAAAELLPHSNVGSGTNEYSPNKNQTPALEPVIIPGIFNTKTLLALLENKQPTQNNLLCTVAPVSVIYFSFVLLPWQECVSSILMSLFEVELRLTT